VSQSITECIRHSTDPVWPTSSYRQTANAQDLLRFVQSQRKKSPRKITELTDVTDYTTYSMKQNLKGKKANQGKNLVQKQWKPPMPKKSLNICWMIKTYQIWIIVLQIYYILAIVASQNVDWMMNPRRINKHHDINISPFL